MLRNASGSCRCCFVSSPSSLCLHWVTAAAQKTLLASVRMPSLSSGFLRAVLTSFRSCSCSPENASEWCSLQPSLFIRYLPIEFLVLFPAALYDFFKISYSRAGRWEDRGMTEAIHGIQRRIRPSSVAVPGSKIYHALSLSLPCILTASPSMRRPHHLIIGAKKWT